MEKSTRILKNLMRQDLFLRTFRVGLYASYRNEVITYPLIRRALQLDKLVSFPRITDPKTSSMEFYQVSGLLHLSSGYHGILEPGGERPLMEEPQLLIMPLVAFDESRNRLGYGRGYYDAYLAAHPAIHTIALAYTCQRRVLIPTFPCDVRPEMIITEDGVYTENE